MRKTEIDIFFDKHAGHVPLVVGSLQLDKKVFDCPLSSRSKSAIKTSQHGLLVVQEHHILVDCGELQLSPNLLSAWVKL